jgi:hypothetical protein
MLVTVSGSENGLRPLRKSRPARVSSGSSNSSRSLSERCAGCFLLSRQTQTSRLVLLRQRRHAGLVLSHFLRFLLPGETCGISNHGAEWAGAEEWKGCLHGQQPSSERTSLALGSVSRRPSGRISKLANMLEDLLTQPERSIACNRQIWLLWVKLRVDRNLRGAREKAIASR